MNNTNDDRNTGAHYDRAIALIKLQEYSKALEDLNQMIIIAKTAPPTPTPAPTSILTATSVLNITDVPLVSSAVGLPNETALSITTAPTITATSVITLTPSPGASTSRFISAELIIKTVTDAIRGNEELLSYLRGQTAYQDLSETLGLSPIAQENTPVSPGAPTTTINPIAVSNYSSSSH